MSDVQAALLSPAQIMERLQDIEADLGERQNEYGQAADDYARRVRDWDHRLALYMKKAPGSNAEARKAHALVAAIEQDDLYERLSDAEARHNALKVVTRTLEQRATIGMGLLKAHGNILPLDRRCHQAFDEGSLDVLPVLTRDEQAYAVWLVGLEEARRRLTNVRVPA